LGLPGDERKVLWDHKGELVENAVELRADLLQLLAARLCFEQVLFRVG
jgi:hypothetical protein